MQSTSSHHPNRLHLITASRPGTTTTRRALLRPRRSPLRGRHILVIAPDDARDRAGIGDRSGIGAHTAGLADHLAATAASVGVIPAPGGAAGVRVRSLTAGLPHPPDAVIAVLPGLTGAVAAARVARRLQVPLVLVVHDLLAARPDGTGERGLTMAAAAERRLLRTAARVAVVVPELATPLYRLGIPAEHVHLLPHWAPAPTGPVLLTDPLADKVAARRALGWPVRPFTVVAAGGRGSHADVTTLRATTAELAGEVAFVILDDAPPRLAPVAADVLLLTERAEAGGLMLPRTLAHYLAAGRPVLAAAHGTSPVAAELQRSRGAGLVIPPGQPALLAAAIRDLRADDERRAAMGRAAALHAAGRLDRRGTMRELETMLCSALGDVTVDLTTA